MAGELAAAREEVAAALRAGGVAAPAPGDPLAVPGAIVRPGDPWLEPARVGPRGTRTVRLSILLLAGAADTLASLVALEELAEAAVLATSGLGEWSTPKVSAARAAEVFGALYLVAELTLERIVTLT